MCDPKAKFTCKVSGRKQHPLHNHIITLQNLVSSFGKFSITSSLGEEGLKYDHYLVDCGLGWHDESALIQMILDYHYSAENGTVMW